MNLDNLPEMTDIFIKMDKQIMNGYVKQIIIFI